MTKLLEVRNLQKIYDNGTIANNEVNFDLNKGEIHALVGENGAGKSTLMKMLFGMEQPTEGQILMHGQPVTIESTKKAIEMGIGMVHQHFMLVPSFTIAENCVLGDEPLNGLSIDKKEAIRRTNEASDKYKFNLDPKQVIANVSVGIKQKVEILKALMRGADILILDEPTAVLTPQETEELFVQLDNLKEQGHTIIFISHKLNEVKQISDRVTVIRKGTTKGTYKTQDVDETEISSLMIGKEFTSKVNKKPIKAGENVLEVNNLSYDFDGQYKAIENITFGIHQHEIIGVAGVEGNGQETLVNILNGQIKDYKGKAAINGYEIKDQSIHDLRKRGMAYVPEDRMSIGIAEGTSIVENIIANRFDEEEWNRGLLLNQEKMDRFTQEMIDSYKIECQSPDQNISSLSGGNIQKVVVAREFTNQPKFLIVDQPTRGVDISAAHLIRQKALKLRETNCGILLFSADLTELLELSDELFVMFGGEIVAYFNDVGELNEETLGLYMLGIEKMSTEEIRRNQNELR